MGRGRKKLSIDVKLARLEAQLKELYELKNADAAVVKIVEEAMVKKQEVIEPI